MKIVDYKNNIEDILLARPLVSVVIPTYNREKTLARSVKSVLNQTYDKIEVIVVDDGSIDNTKQIVESFDDERVRYIWQENAGASSARNKGIFEAKGEFVAFQDSDDKWYENKLSEQLKVINETGADMVCCPYKRIGETGENLGIIPQDISKSGFIKEDILLCGNKCSTQTFMCKKELFLKVMFDESLKSFEDWEFALNVLRNGMTIYFINNIFVKVYVQSVSITANENHYESIDKIIKKHRVLYEKYPQIYAKMLYDMAFVNRMSNRDLAGEYLKQSWHYSHNIKTLLKIVLNSLNLWNAQITTKNKLDKYIK